MELQDGFCRHAFSLSGKGAASATGYRGYVSESQVLSGQVEILSSQTAQLYDRVKNGKPRSPLPASRSPDIVQASALGRI